jgi:hypothetical protein
MNPVREYVRDRVTRQRTVWSSFLALNYELVLRDRIGRVRGAPPNSVPGLWGHSYVRTYYGWMNQHPPDTARMEGGIATTCYVVRSLLALWRRSGTPVPPDVLADLYAFFTHRVGEDGGCGVYTVDHRGLPGIAVHFRHTCFAYLTLADLNTAAALPYPVREKLDATAEYILKVRDPTSSGGTGSRNRGRSGLWRRTLRRETRSMRMARGQVVRAVSGRAYACGCSNPSRKPTVSTYA